MKQNAATRLWKKVPNTVLFDEITKDRTLNKSD